MPYYIGIDIGTGSTKALAVSSTANNILYSTQNHYPTLQPLPHYNEQDPELIWIAFVNCIRQITEHLKEAPNAIGISSAMHSLIPVDSKGKPLMNCIIWADARSTSFAEEVQQSPQASELYMNTGTPIHAMSPFSKIGWMRQHNPEVYSEAHKFISIKEYIWFNLFREFQVDYSIASGSGMFDIHHRTWYAPALNQVGIDKNRLSEPVSPGYHRSDVLPEIQQQLKITSSTTFVIGASDGCLANLGSNAIEPGMASLTIGTSGAIRMASAQPCYNFKRMTFNYLLDENTFICGGPINNGGAVWKWFVKNFIDPDPDKADYSSILEKANTVNPGSDGLIFLPYLLGERAPIWNSKACGTFFGITIQHTENHFVRSVIEGICFALYSVGSALEEASGKIDSIYASGGVVQSKEWLQIIADVFNKKVYRQNSEDASAIGAALMAIKSYEKLPIYPVFTTNEPPEVIFPDLGRHQMYQKFYPFFVRLYAKLNEEMNALFYLTSQTADK